ncbi:MAG: PrgI family protein [Thermales bacterium]|nr:PrgI family protein [Thermales bacterium]
MIKILGPLNVRQFAYALGGGFLGIMIFTVTQSLSPGIGNYAFIPVIPVIGLTAYLALGKYNGRDTEVYVLKMILYYIKPRLMKFAKIPDFVDLNAEFSKLTYNNILNEWNKRTQLSKEAETNILSAFRSKDSQAKAKKIRELGITVDRNIRNTLEQTFELESKKENTQSKINTILNKPNITKYSPTPLINETQTKDSYQPANFFSNSSNKKTNKPSVNKLSELKKKLKKV